MSYIKISPTLTGDKNFICVDDTTWLEVRSLARRFGWKPQGTKIQIHQELMELSLPVEGDYTGMNYQIEYEHVLFSDANELSIALKGFLVFIQSPFWSSLEEILNSDLLSTNGLSFEADPQSIHTMYELGYIEETDYFAWLKKGIMEELSLFSSGESQDILNSILYQIQDDFYIRYCRDEEDRAHMRSWGTPVDFTEYIPPKDLLLIEGVEKYRED